jgi:glycosyltransferase involved in cell wall biosynthesis
MVVSGFPRRSETFLLNELLALEEAGALVAIFATKPGEPGPLQPDAARLSRRVTYLPDASEEHQACLAAAHLAGKTVSGVHGYFAHQPARVARQLARRLHVPFGFSAHARDLRKIDRTTLRNLGNQAAGVLVCNSDAADVMRNVGRIAHLTPHGVDLQRFSRTAQSSHARLRLLAVGRLVEKKGFHVLLDAVAQLEVPFELRIIGDGVERASLEARAAALGIRDDVRLTGSLTHADLPDQYAWAHVVVVPSVLDRAGDRDGLPNVVLEAMATARAVVASDTPAIRMAVSHGMHGLLAPAGEPTVMAAALARLARDEGLRQQLGDAARSRVERDFALPACSRRFCEAITRLYG